jgi:hypothetical protein
VLVIALNLQMLLGVIGSGAIAGAVLYIIGLFAADWLYIIELFPRFRSRKSFDSRSSQKQKS